jgi:hypothetical protein
MNNYGIKNIVFTGKTSLAEQKEVINTYFNLEID